ncbi:MAG: hypothetical protein A4E57_00466 [Syntrophorhabdaceae bacterium PtaU1.Bin034]|nr:MAG: hypothetical protein A4E57_00466 [Syntrophorhabdaceae bacterium PtaU1.Bin034]
MRSGKTGRGSGAGKTSANVLQELVSIFDSKGWLDQELRIRYRGARYRVFCSKIEFFAYRINESCGVSPGMPGWPVCVVWPDQVFDDSEMCAFGANEPGINDWLRCLADGDFEVI